MIIIPAGTRTPLSLIISIHTKLARRGDVVHLETQYPVLVDTASQSQRKSRSLTIHVFGNYVSLIG